MTIQELLEEKSSKKTTGQPLTSAVQECPFKKRSEDLKENKKTPCGFEKVEYSITAADLNANAKVLEIKDDDNIAEFVAGYRSDVKTLSIKLTATEGPCPTHNTKVFDSRSTLKDKTDASAGLELKAHEFSLYKNGRFYFPSEAKYLDYNVSSSTCKKKKKFHFRIYPDVELNFNLQVNFSRSLKSKKSHSLVKSKFEGPANFGEEPHPFNYEATNTRNSGSKIDISASYKLDGRTDTISLLEFEHKLKKIQDTAEVVQNFHEKIKELVGDIASFDFTYPGLSFKGFTKFEEAEGEGKNKYQVVLKNRLEIGLKPLVGASGSIDIMGSALLLLPAASGLYKLVHYIKKLADSANSKKLDLNLEAKFTASGTIEGSMFYETISRNRVVKDERKGGDIVGKVELELKMEALGVFDVLICSFGGGINVNATCGATGKVELYTNTSTDTIQGVYKIDFEGMVANLVIYMQVSGIKAVEKNLEPDVVDPKALNDQSSETNMGKGKKEFVNKKMILMESGVMLKPTVF